MMLRVIAGSQADAFFGVARYMLKGLVIGVAGIVIAFMLLAAGAWLYLASQFDTPEQLTRVVGLPEGYDPIAPADSYTGPHLSQVQRPAETFEFPIALGETGPVGPLFAGAPDYPFLCRSEESGLGQPLVDNGAGAGMPVYEPDENEEKSTEIAGYSKDCSLPTRAAYFYKRVGTDAFFPLAAANGDIEKIVVGGRETDFVVRIETGTINRYIYAIAALRGANETLEQPDGSHWNGRLIYQFRGGIGIGRRQGRVTAARVAGRRAKDLARGYAVAYSSGNQTSNHYDPLLAEDTALRVKRQFIALYGEPLYTVGVGGSGGAIQQYLIAQNNPDLLDALVPQYSYPDMVTQTTYGLDCELMEYYFDVTDVDNERWRDWSNRSLVEGFNANAESVNIFARVYALVKLANFRLPTWSSGLTECVNAWRGAAPNVNNPRYVHFGHRFNDDIIDAVHWSYWDNLKRVFGTDRFGHARRTFDNVGVQYGLAALREGRLSTEEFLDLNARIGSWKHPRDMQPERYWRQPGARSALANTSPWSHHNMQLGEPGRPAPRNEGDLRAIEAAYLGGQVFMGDIDLPVIDLRHYLDPELDMHHAVASFSARKRMLRANGHAENQLIWMTRKPHEPTALAFDVIDRWLANIRRFPDRSVADNRPLEAVDTCFDASGEMIAAGDGVWDGEWNGKPPGKCLRTYPSFSTSRMVAGEDIAGDTLKCVLQSIDQAVAAGIYGDTDMRPHRARLAEIFPDGVCDYARPGVGKPEGVS